ncbi:UDP-N-acetylmuramoyl-tripeptide--D-alanyl-D-alanine ligase [Clostridium sp. MSJ-11]|uniref:UDP-N-acetylmuramoyl-tripeptide--D-alanyl-D-alanine ligase n=1 Tax=Clostridium mobile TaxID=2841512 RepID=A0ABS6ECR5_9CLOT|nr:UDP-N-acetylmuramoyl-tripeptide--D-alanyl-D-alanine ligase [Clostridium mobile]MBU5482986.1 UDP-N-acetylmuramoyl-tripeptide--D-alanyl-D-alanine ligase [Clostridium mobile]
MEFLSIDEVVKAINGKIVKEGNSFKFNGVSTDTRKIEKGNIFFALKGENFNGNSYINDASDKGATLCIIDEIMFNEEKIKEYTSIIKVENTRKALLDLAEYYRSKLNIKIVGITGSTGKTSTKDLTAAALSSKYKVFKTEGNFNNEIGLPLMIFKLNNDYDVAVLEFGMNNLGEIHRMCKAARPDIALITNVGISHIENLKTRENILKAKLEIADFFHEDNVLIVNGDNDLLSPLNSHKFNIIKAGFNNKEDYYANHIILNEDNVLFTVCEEKTGENEEIEINLPGKHNVWNALLSIACGRVLGMSLKEIREGLKNISTTGMRLDIIREEKYTIINDCYNASPDSMKAGIDVLINIKGERKIAVLGTMKELGDEAYNAHKEVGKYVAEKGVEVLITLGEFNKAYEEGYVNETKGEKKEIFNFNSEDEAANFLRDHIKYGDVLLFKASRSMKFEGIIKKLKTKE